MIRVTLGTGLESQVHTVSDLLFSIGRSADNAVVTVVPAVSGHHLEIAWELSGYRLRDLDSSNGVWLPQGRINEAWLEDTLECFLGNLYCRLEVCDPLLLTELYGKCLMASETCRFGRALDNDWVIAHPTVSQHHGCFIREGGQVLVENLSAQGVKVDGLPVRHTPLAAGSVIEIGAVAVKLDTSFLDLGTDLTLSVVTPISGEGETEVQVDGNLGRDQADQLAETLKQLRARGARTIRLDLANCRQLHPRSLEVLLEEVGRESGRSPLLLLNPSVSVRRALALANAEQALPCIRSSN